MNGMFCVCSMCLMICFMWLKLVMIICGGVFGVMVLYLCLGFFVCMLSSFVVSIISNGVSVIDSVIISINMLCIVLFNSCWLVVCLSIMKVNLLLQVSSIVRCSVLLLFSLFSVCFSGYSSRFLVSSSVVISLFISSGMCCSRFRFIDMFMLMKNSFSSSFLNGLMCDFSLCWYFELVSSMLVRKVFSVVDMFIFFISQVVFIIISSVVVVDIFIVLVLVMKWNIGCSRKCLFIIIIMMMFIVWVMLIRFMLWCEEEVVSSGIIVISGIVVRFWNSRMENVCCLQVELVFLCLVRICSLNVVDDSVRLLLMIIVVLFGRFSSRYMIVLIISVLVIICSVLVLNIEWCIIYSCCGESFRLIMNSISIMLNLEMVVMLCVLFISFSSCGLIIMLVLRQLSIVFS